MDELLANQVLLFPGLGSPFVGMASPPGEATPEGWQRVSRGVGLDVEQVCQHGPPTLLQREDISQAALLAHTYGVMSRLRQAPSLAMGYSVGGYSLLAAFGVWSLEAAQEAFRCSQRHLSHLLPPGWGDLAGVLGLPLEEVLDLCRGGDLHLAAINGPYHTLIGGKVAALEAAFLPLRRRGALSVRRLGLQFPYHTPLLAGAVAGVKADSPPPQLTRTKIPLWCGGPNPPSRDVKELVESLAEQLATPIPWWTRLSHVSSGGDMTLVDVGPGRFLARLARPLPVKVLVWEQIISPGLEVAR